MVAFQFTRRLRMALSAVTGAFLLMGAHPALADTATRQSPLGEGDAQFHELFASWQSLDSRPGQSTDA